MQIPVMNFDIEQAGKAVFSSTGTFASLSAKPKHFVVTVPAISLYAQLIPGNLFLIVSKSFMAVVPIKILSTKLVYCTDNAEQFRLPVCIFSPFRKG